MGARLIVKVFRGAKPADIPIEQPTKERCSRRLQGFDALEWRNRRPTLLLLARLLLMTRQRKCRSRLRHMETERARVRVRNQVAVRKP
jgi:hypothetical protein